MKTTIKIILISTLFTFISYIFYKIDYSRIFSIWDLITSGLPDAIKVIVNNDFLNKFPRTPLFIFWGIVGTLVYLLYHSLDLTYSKIWNWAIIKFYFVKALDKHKFITSHYIKRGLTHLGIVISYLLFIILIIFVFIPFTASIFGNVSLVNMVPALFEDQALFIIGFCVLTLWSVFFSFFILLFLFVHNKMVAEDIIEDHELGIA